MIKIKLVYGILPAIIWYTNNISDTRYGGVANGPLIRIRSKYVIDHGLLEHELTHVKQWYRTGGLHGLLYRFSSDYRLRSEVEAYRAQLQHPRSTTSIAYAVKAIQTKYSLDTDSKKITELLQ